MAGDRRGRALVLSVIAAVIVANAAVLAVVARSNTSDGLPQGWVRVASVDVIQRRGVVHSRAARAFAVSTPSGIVALIARSTQLGEPLTYCPSSGFFRDRSHGSLFDSQGRYVLGPAPRGLDRFATHVLGGVVYADTSNIYLGPPRGSHDPVPDGGVCSAEG
jgi:Rieske Fe-S protein